MRGISRIRLSFDDSRLWTGCVVQGLGGDRRSGSISEWKQVVKLAGFDLSADRSGKGSERAIPLISKRGKADLPYALYQVALIASTRNREFIRHFTNRIRGREKEKGIQRKLLAKFSAKMLLIAWTLMKKKEAFNSAYLK